MLNSLTIKGRMYLIIASILVLFVLMIVFAVNTSNKSKNTGIEKAGHAMLEDQKAKIKVATHSMGVAISNMIKDAGSDKDKIQIIRKLLKDIRFEKDKSGYFFVNKGTIMYAHIKKSLQDKD